jgi:2,3-bisphosphoglycerate-independent phosphoglycerate mutase
MRIFKQVILVVMDGLGVASPSDGNAVTLTYPRNLNFLINDYPATTLQASGPAVGLPWGERGNSEVGHLNIGAGRIIIQDLPRVSHAISTGEFFNNPAFLAALKHVKKNNSKLHLVGLVSAGGIHSSEEHLYALLTLAAAKGLKKVFVHMFTDGRDTPPKAALESLDKLSRKFLELGVGKIASVTGRFYAMDRGLHWELTEATYKAIVLGKGEVAVSAREAVSGYYRQQIFDEVIPPTVIGDKQGEPLAKLVPEDSVIFFNFRPDRMVQLAWAMVDPAFNKFSQKYPYLQDVCFVTMTAYEKNLPALAAFPPPEIRKSLSEVLSEHHLTQFHIAESEKYAHVASFFNGGIEAPWPLEEREIISSPAQYQKRYEDVPEMRADEIGKRVREKLQAGVNFILANFANPDMVGHTANKEACIRAIEAVDRNLGMIFEAVLAADACLVVTADHGNIEQIIDLRTGLPDKEHTTNPVPLVAAGNSLKRKHIKSRGYLELPGIVPEGVLSDIAPTILELLGLPKPSEMTSVSLLPLLLKEAES